MVIEVLDVSMISWVDRTRGTPKMDEKSYCLSPSLCKIASKGTGSPVALLHIICRMSAGFMDLDGGPRAHLEP